MAELSVLSVFIDTATGYLYARKPDGTTQLIGDGLAVNQVGEANTASNVGSAGVGLYKTKSGVNLQFYKVEGTGGIVVAVVGDHITVDGSGLGGGGGGGGAPDNATFVTLSNNATLSNERVLTQGSCIVITDGGANGPVTVGFAPPGSDTLVPFNDGGVLNADSGLAYSKLPQMLSVSGLVQTERVRRTAARVALDTTSADLYLGGDNTSSNQFGDAYLYAASGVHLGIGASSGLDMSSGATTVRCPAGPDAIAVTTSLVRYGLPRIGAGTPYSSEGEANITGSSRSASANEYARTIWNISMDDGSTLTIPHPATGDASYVKRLLVTTVSLTITDGVHSVTLPNTGTGGVLSVGNGQIKYTYGTTL